MVDRKLFNKKNEERFNCPASQNSSKFRDITKCKDFWTNLAVVS